MCRTFIPRMRSAKPCDVVGEAQKMRRVDAKSMKCFSCTYSMSCEMSFAFLQNSGVQNE